ncbi:sigma-54-dependent Fis family transcriptional regulator [Sesbania bispinosa]|nr:sigma-54-dependent Fis family transcriptional regulator [Sesbania bispinosa]
MSQMNNSHCIRKKEVLKLKKRFPGNCKRSDARCPLLCQDVCTTISFSEDMVKFDLPISAKEIPNVAK